MPVVNVYIDGFNLYYGMYRNKKRKHDLRRFKWLDLRAVAISLLNPGEAVGEIYYCTADVSSPLHDPDRSNRQIVFQNALKFYAGVTIVKGSFEVRQKRGVPLDTATHGTIPIEINIYEEKGTDVNLATLLLRDAFTGQFDRAIVISNDSDLALAIESTVQVARKPVMVVSPHLGVTAKLKAAASNNDVLRPRTITQCQMPNPVRDASGQEYHKPRRW